MFLILGIASIKDKDGKKGMDILFLILEVRKGVDKTIKEGEGLMWLEMLDDVLLKDMRNVPRGLFKIVSGSMEMAVTELSGKATKLGLLNLAKTVSTSLTLLTLPWHATCSESTLWSQ